LTTAKEIGHEDRGC